MVRKTIEETIDKIKKELDSYFTDRKKDAKCIVEASGIEDNIHVIIITDYFEKQEKVTRDDEMYKYLEKRLSPDELITISLFLTLTREEYNRYMISDSVGATGYPEPSGVIGGQAYT